MSKSIDELILEKNNKIRESEDLKNSIIEDINSNSSEELFVKIIVSETNHTKKERNFQMYI